MASKMLAIQPGSSFSTADVYRGIVLALCDQGQHVIHYPLDRAMSLGLEYCRLLKKRGYVQDLDAAGVQYIAGVFALDRALHHDVEWVLVFSAMFFHIDFLVKLKFAGRKVALVLTESPYDEEQERQRAHFADVVFTNERTTAARLAKLHPDVHYLPHAYDPNQHRPEPVDDEPEVLAHDVVFVGTGWPERIKLLAGVNWEGIDLGLYGNWGKVGKQSPLRPFISEGPIPNTTTAALYRHAKIGLNIYRYGEGAESLNPRAYELAASGLFHLSDDRLEVGEVFGNLVPTFVTAADLEAQLRHYLAHEDERQAIAAQLPGAVRGAEFAARARVVAERLGALSTRKEGLPV